MIIEFRLFDTVNGGGQLRATVTRNMVTVANGVNNAAAHTHVGIGTTAPKAKLDVTGGNILVGSPGQGIILKSPNSATCRLLSIDNAGAMVLTAIACLKIKSPSGATQTMSHLTGL